MKTNTLENKAHCTHGVLCFFRDLNDCHARMLWWEWMNAKSNLPRPFKAQQQRVVNPGEYVINKVPFSLFRKPIFIPLGNKNSEAR
ncbi:MAG: hypothetical protein JEZ12_21790 [Desulfobacterium sp.]|nr:hypothetical protein [Desulfobacterium sp.]